MALSFSVRENTEGRRPRRAFPLLLKSRLGSFLFPTPKVPQTNPLMGLQTESSKFSLENQRINTSSVLALSHKLVSAPMDRFI